MAGTPVLPGIRPVAAGTDAPRIVLALSAVIRVLSSAPDVVAGRVRPPAEEDPRQRTA